MGNALDTPTGLSEEKKTIRANAGWKETMIDIETYNKRLREIDKIAEELKGTGYVLDRIKDIVGVKTNKARDIIDDIQGLVGMRDGGEATDPETGEPTGVISLSHAELKEKLKKAESEIEELKDEAMDYEALRKDRDTILEEHDEYFTDLVKHKERNAKQFKEICDIVNLRSIEGTDAEMDIQKILGFHEDDSDEEDIKVEKGDKGKNWA
jgi:hypothetical protein